MPALAAQDANAAGNKNKSWGFMRSIFLLIVLVSTFLVVALIGSSFMGATKLPSEDPAQAYDDLETNFYQGALVDGDADTYSDTDTVHSYTTTLDYNVYSRAVFSFRNMAIYTLLKVDMKFTGAFNSENQFGTQLYSSILFNPCSNNTITQSVARRLEEALDTDTEEMPAMANEFADVHRKLYDDLDAWRPPMSYFYTKDTCQLYGEACSHAGGVAIVLIAFAFVFTVVAGILQILRLCGMDSGKVCNGAVMLHINSAIFCCAAVGAFTANCTVYYTTGLKNALDPVGLKAKLINGTVANVLISAIVFSICNAIINCYFRYQVPEDKSSSSATLAPAAPPRKGGHVAHPFGGNAKI